MAWEGMANVVRLAQYYEQPVVSIDGALRPVRLSQYYDQQIVYGERVVDGPVYEQKIVDERLTVLNVFSGSGGTWPMYNATTPPAFRSAVTGKYWFFWEAWQALLSRRELRCAVYDPATGILTPEIVVGPTPLTNDDHGVPSACEDSNGFVYCFGGAHDSAMQVFSTRNADDPFSWTEQTEISGNYTYPHPFVVADTLYLFMQLEDGSSTSDTIVLRTAAAWGSGTASFSAEVDVIDLGPDARAYLGNGVVVGANIHLVATRSDAADDIREHVYYFVYETDTGDVRNFADSVTIDVLDLPVDLTESNASFRVFTHSGGNTGIIPQLYIDGASESHVALADGTEDDLDVKYIRSGNAWASPVTVGHMTNRFDGATISGRPANGDLDIWWVEDDGGAFTRGGNLKRNTRLSGTFGGEVLVFGARSKPLDIPVMTSGGSTHVRIVASEQAQQSSTEDGALESRGFIEGGVVNFLRGRYIFGNAQAEAVLARAREPMSYDDRYLLDNLMTSALAINKFAGICFPVLFGNQTDACLNLIDDDFNLTIAGSPTFTPFVGFTGNGTNATLNTGWVPSVQGSRDNHHIGVVTLNATDSGQQVCGASDGTNLSFIITTNGSQSVYRINTNLSGNVNNTQTTGHWVANRAASTAHTLDRNGTQIDTENDAASALVGAQIGFLGIPSVAFSDQKEPVMHWGASMTTGERTDWYFEGVLPILRRRGLQ